MSHILFICTGNAARSVMAGAALAAHLPDWEVTTAGTLVVEGQPMSWRTRAALESVGLQAPSHRSRQATDADL
ncbi:MAG TPA: low molecular weight phosphatase family protein, partial [Acidimicrobiales bacterium]